LNILEPSGVNPTNIIIIALEKSCILKKLKELLRQEGVPPLPAPPTSRYSLGGVYQNPIKLRVSGDSLYPNLGRHSGGVELRKRGLISEPSKIIRSN
jgi:hypothetical protein